MKNYVNGNLGNFGNVSISLQQIHRFHRIIRKGCHRLPGYHKKTNRGLFWASLIIITITL